MKKISLVAVYSHADELLEVIQRVKEKHPERMVIYSPIPLHGIEEVLGRKTSPVRFFTLFGAIAGLVGGFALAIWSSLKWHIITGGKPVVTLVPFVIVAFEMTILLGALATLLGLVFSNQFPNYRIANTYDPRFTRDKFGIAVKIAAEKKPEYENLLQSTGAEEIHVR